MQCNILNNMQKQFNWNNYLTVISADLVCYSKCVSFYQITSAYLFSFLLKETELVSALMLFSSVVEQVQNHHKLIKVTFKKLLKADDIKLSREEAAACIALVLEELLSKADRKHTSNTCLRAKYEWVTNCLSWLRDTILVCVRVHSDHFLIEKVTPENDKKKQTHDSLLNRTCKCPYWLMCLCLYDFCISLFVLHDDKQAKTHWSNTLSGIMRPVK